LVNVVLFPVFVIVILVGRSLGWASAHPDVYQLLNALAVINFGLLMFNILPIYPLDGGQILRSLLWFVVGPARSLMIATIIGFISVAGLIAVALNPNSQLHSLWFGVLFAFILLNCWRGWQVARALTQVANAPRHEGFACPLCHVAPPRGAYWICGKCRTAFDTFETRASCPHCGAQFAVTRCVDCGKSSSFEDWLVAPPLPSSRSSEVPPVGTA
jgi:hypothetical protein